MIKDFVRDNQAYLKCSECGAELQMLHYEFVKRRGEDDFGINMEKTIEGIEAFVTKHSLCQKPAKQLRIIDNQL